MGIDHLCRGIHRDDELITVDCGAGRLPECENRTGDLLREFRCMFAVGLVSEAVDWPMFGWLGNDLRIRY